MNRLFKYIKQPLWNNWYIDKKIGQGNYSEVYRIYSGNKVSALKVKPVFAENYESLKRKLTVAEKEANIISVMKDCPYIMKYQNKEIQKISDLQSLVMIQTELLNPINEIQIFSENEVHKIAIDIGKALEYIHSSGVVHCDVKPDNFFISSSGIYKIGDFNISGYAGEKRYFSGTFEYTAPEVYNSNIYDYRSDIYSFGKSLYNLMNNISSEFLQIIEKACSELHSRYQTITEMLSDIYRIEKHYYVSWEYF